MIGKTLRGLSVLLLSAPLLAMPAQAAGDDGGTSTQCSGGLVWDARQSKCVEPQSGAAETERLYARGREMTVAGRYGEAITLLSKLAGRDDPRVFNYLGFAHRMQGRVSVGLGYYREALRVDPDYTLARAYMGEAYLQLGDRENALLQLFEIEMRCGRDCYEYVELAERIEKYRKGG